MPTPRETIRLGAVDLSQVAQERYARENIDELLWVVDADESTSRPAIDILGEVNDRLRNIYAV